MNLLVEITTLERTVQQRATINLFANEQRVRYSTSSLCFVHEVTRYLLRHIVDMATCR